VSDAVAIATNGPVELYFETFGRVGDETLLSSMARKSVHQLDVELCQRSWTVDSRHSL